MATTIQRVDKDTFKQIFRDHWETFTQHQPRYQDRHVQAVIDKMLGCGTPESGYTTYLCPHCLEEKRVAFSCKSSFCLSCCKVYIDEWVSHIGRTLYEGVSYRHVVLTMPDALHIEFYRQRVLLADLMKCGVAGMWGHDVRQRPARWHGSPPLAWVAGGASGCGTGSVCGRRPVPMPGGEGRGFPGAGEITRSGSALPLAGPNRVKIFVTSVRK
jgi:hypothetical protein